MAKRGDKMVEGILSYEKNDVGKIQVMELGKVFKSIEGNAITALESVSLNIQPGEFISLIGPSGCGKSTFLRMLAGLEVPTTGRILLDGSEIKGTSYERGLVFQNPKLFPWMNIYNNIAFGLKARKVYKEKKDEVKEFIELVGLEGFEKSYPHHLSGGMAQRAALARALINHPKVLLLDEPLGALDAFTRVTMQDEIIKIWQDRKTTMIMVTHDVEEAIYMSDRIIVMTPRPAKVETIINVKLKRSRKRDDRGFLDLRNQILDIMDFSQDKEKFKTLA